MSECDSELRESLLRYFQYEKFNGHVTPDGNNQICERLSVQGNMPKNFKNFCYILSKNIKEVCKTMDNPSRNGDLCEPLNYWVYDTLIKNKLLKNEEDISKSEIINELPKLWDLSNFKQMCEFKKYKMSTTDFRYMKELYDYSKHYSAIEYNQNNHRDHQCRKQYCSYIKKVKKIYDTVKPFCAAQNNKPYCEILRKIPVDKIPNVFLEGYQCSDNEMNDDYIKDEKIFTKPLLPPPQDESINSLVLETSTSAKGSYKDKPEDASSNPSVKVGLSTFGMSLVPLFLIYKFTPGGNFLRRIINKKIGTNYNTGEIPSGDWFSISREHQNDIQTNREFNVLYQNIEKK
ncbi:PIR protein [Plasmodium vivax]|uniref:VIR protein n=1 Tax=Plasmodium vivax TaxID=5855 RepID=A0A565A5Y0_PLAVI|nr:PIR protein [Plasmodium vivax]